MKRNQNIPILTTERLVLRPPDITDAPALYKSIGRDERITRYTGWNPYLSLEAAKRKIADDLETASQGEGWSWIITAGGRLIGTVGAYDVDRDTVSAELGLTIIQSEWGKGYGAEALTSVVSHLLCEDGLNRVCAWCHADNVASEKAMRRAGMTLEGVFRQAMRDPSGKLVDQKWFARIKEDFRG